MWSHNLRLALRTLARDKSAALLGGLSLAVALASCVLIALFVRDELSYDRDIPNATRISTFGIESEFGGERDAYDSTPYVLAGTLSREVPSIESAVTTKRMYRASVLRGREGEGAEIEGLYADSTFFDVFALPVVAGSVTSALDSPGSVVFTASAARRVLGGVDVVGRDVTVLTNSDTLVATVRAVVADLPQPTSLRVEMVLPLSGYLEKNPEVGLGWGMNMWNTYALRRPGSDRATLRRSLAAISEANRLDETMNVLDVPLVEYRFSEFASAKGFGASALYVRLFAAVALLILLLGAINYVNLATARGARRAREIGVRKALGSGRGALVRQFLTESVVLSALAGAVGLGLAAVALPLFNETFGKEMTLSSLDPAFLVGLVASALVVGVVAGLYPAVYLSNFEPSRVLRGGSAPAEAAGEAFLARTWLRRGLIVFQLTAAILLVVGTASVFRQVQYAQEMPLGLDPSGLVVVPIQSEALVAQSGAVKAAVLQTPGVVAAAGATGVPPKLMFAMETAPDDTRPDLKVGYKVLDGDADYADVLGLRLVAGRWYGTEDGSRGVVVNEAFVDAMNWAPEDAVGRDIVTGADQPSTIVGVTTDFHYSSLREPVGPTMIGPARADGMSWGEDDTGYGEVAVRFAPGREVEGIASLRATWERLDPDAAFEPRFAAEDFAALSEDETRLAKTFGLFAGIAVLIAAFGLIGLATYTAERRTKEVGIRKVLGASTAGLVGLLSREYVALVAVAAVLAAPVAVVLARRWLEGFVYHAPFSPLVIVGAAVSALVLALASVGVQALRAARRDPVQSLRSE